MKIKLLLSISILLLAFVTYSQQRFCADSSIRVKYIFGYPQSTLFNNPDTVGTNIFTGEYMEGGKFGIALLKTNWGDSMFWAKKLFINGKDVANRNSFTAPGGTIICTGIWGGAVNNNPELLISRIDTNGNVLWAKRFKFNPIHLYYYPDSRVIKNILIANNAIYFNALFNSYFNIIAKLDLNGNIIWSKSFTRNTFYNAALVDAPAFVNNNIVFAASVYDQQTPMSAAKLYNVITKLNDGDGSVMEANSYKTIIDTLGLFTRFFKSNSDNSFSLTGFLGVADGSGIFGLTDIIFNSKIDTNLNLNYNYYYKNSVLLDAQDSYFDFNNQKRHAFLSGDVFKPADKYFVTFDKNDKVQHTRKFSLPSAYGNIYRNSLNFDDKENLHFIYQYTQGGQFVTEYARIGNFAPSSTPGCVGKDTSILTQYPFTLIKSPFTWDNVTSDVLISNPVVFTEDTAIVTKELVCKLVSYCDSIHISGPATACINQPVRYSVVKNPTCLKSLQWNIDTAMATIVSTEADTAITLSFKQAFTGYIHAAVYNCVVNDSFFVTITAPQNLKLANRDSLLCPGKTIVLNAMTGFTNYTWQDGSAGTSYTVTGPGFYKVTATNNCGLQTADSINITLSDTSLFVPTTQTICSYDTAYIPFAADITNITWQPTVNSLLSNNTLRLYPKQNTLYNIVAQRIPNCPISKTTAVVVENCARIVFIPNSFTPNGDSHNDVFRVASTKPLQFFRLSIYNRYGQKLFETNNPAQGWDGNFKNAKQATGGYVYQCSYGFAGGYQKTENGYFILIR